MGVLKKQLCNIFMIYYDRNENSQNEEDEEETDEQRVSNASWRPFNDNN